MRPPAWLDVERLPWWLSLVLAALFLALGLDGLLTGESASDRVVGAGMAVLVAPAQLLAARRRRRGLPLARAAEE